MTPAPTDTDIIIEMQQQGNFVKVTAMDPVTYTEVSMVGDPAVGENALKRQVVKKLHYVMAKNGAPQ